MLFPATKFYGLLFSGSLGVSEYTKNIGKTKPRRHPTRVELTPIIVDTILSFLGNQTAESLTG